MLLLEAQTCFGKGASSRNCEANHSEIYYRRGSRKALCPFAGNTSCTTTALGVASRSRAIAKRSNRRVKREPGSAHGMRVVRTPWVANRTRGTRAQGRIRNKHVSKRRHRGSTWSWIGLGAGHSGQPNDVSPAAATQTSHLARLHQKRDLLDLPRGGQP